MRLSWRLLLSTALVLSLAAGASLAQVSGTLEVNNERLQGTNVDGYPLLYAPNPVQLGSSISHWDTSATPNLLMEPSINSDLAFLNLDVTPAQMQDIGWSLGTSSFNIVNLDPPGVGFTDPTPFGGAPGNPATTLGEARIELFNAVLSAWANTLDSPVEIDVQVTWQPLFCDPNQGAVLAGASTILIFQSLTVPFQGTWYHSALAEALLGIDLSGGSDSPDGTDDIFVIVNSAIDDGCLQPGSSYYYGLDGNNAANQIDLAPVVLHEVGHGLGFANFTDETDGQLVQGSPGVFDQFTYDVTAGKTWAEMNTDAERVASAINTRRVVWNGPLATAAAQDVLTPGVEELTVTSPPELAGRYEVGSASFGVPVPDAGIAGEFACMRDTTGLDPTDTSTDGCSPATNSAELAGKIVLIDRGLCNFTDKVLNAQAAGAIGAVIVNNAGNAPIGLGGNPAAPITIPAVGLGQDDGQRIKDVACPETGLRLNNSRFLVTADWRDPQGQTGTGVPVQLTNDTGYFYFFNPDNVEMVVKVLDACNLGSFNKFWVFAGGLTNVEVELTVTDTQTGAVKVYTNPLNTPFQPIQDTNAFATCP